MSKDAGRILARAFRQPDILRLKSDARQKTDPFIHRIHFPSSGIPVDSPSLSLTFTIRESRQYGFPTPALAGGYSPPESSVMAGMTVKRSESR